MHRCWGWPQRAAISSFNVFQVGLPLSSSRAGRGDGILPLLGPSGLGLILFAPTPWVLQAYASAARPWPLLAPRAWSVLTFGPAVSPDAPWLSGCGDGGTETCAEPPAWATASTLPPLWGLLHAPGARFWVCLGLVTPRDFHLWPCWFSVFSYWSPAVHIAAGGLLGPATSLQSSCGHRPCRSCREAWGSSWSTSLPSIQGTFAHWCFSPPALLTLLWQVTWPANLGEGS